MIRILKQHTVDAENGLWCVRDGEHMLATVRYVNGRCPCVTRGSEHTHDEVIRILVEEIDRLQSANTQAPATCETSIDAYLKCEKKLHEMRCRILEALK